MALDPNKKTSQYCIKSWNLESGLPSNNIYTILQTHDGYLWLGTQGGLIRFDGMSFKSVPLGENISSSYNEIRALYEDQNKILWIGTSHSGLFKYINGKVIPLSYPKYKSPDKISAINEDSNGNIWVGSFSDGLAFLLNGKIPDSKFEKKGISKEVHAIYKDESKILWVASATAIIKIISPDDYQIITSQKAFPYLHISCYFEKSKDTLWIGTGANYLFKYKNKIFKAYGPENGIPHHTVNCIFQDSHKNTWIGTDGKGLARFSNSPQKNNSHYNHLDIGSVYSIYEDSEGSLWIGTLDNGLYQLRDSKFTTITTNEGLNDDYVQCIIEEPNGDLIIGTKGGINQLINNKISAFFKNQTNPIQNSVTCLFRDSNGVLWIGTWGKLHKYTNNRLYSYTIENGLSDDHINCIQEDNQGNIWIGTENGLNRFNKQSGNLFPINKNHGLSDNKIGTIFNDSRGFIWIGTKSGLHYMKNNKITMLDIEINSTSGFFYCVYEDSHGILWFGTENGLICVKEKDNQFQTKTKFPGLNLSHIYSILEDSTENLWLGGRNGIAKVKKEDLVDLMADKIKQIHPVFYNEKDGMKARWCSGKGCKSHKGLFYFPTSKGIAIIDPNNIKTNNIKPFPFIEKITINGKPLDIFNNPNHLSPLEFPPGKKRLEFYFTAASFINPQKIVFKSKLLGYDEDWVEMGNIRKATYTGLLSGQYTFNVKVANSEGIWNEENAVLSFYIKPYFYETTWFIGLSFISIIFSIFFIHRLRIRHFKTRQKELSKLVDLRTQDLNERNIQLEKIQQNLQQSKEVIEVKNIQLEAQTSQLKQQAEKLQEMNRIKSRFFANISHEFRTPLTLIIGPLEQMLSDSPESTHQKQIQLMLRNSQRLLGLINQLLELAKFESGKVKLQAYQQNIISLVKGIKANFQALADQQELDLVFKATTDEILLFFDPEKIEEIMSNLLMNAVKFTPPGGKITVSIEQNSNINKDFPNGYTTISIKDTGTGIPREQLSHIFDRFYQTDATYEHNRKGSGIGLALVKELINLHHGKIDVYSQEGKGTGFIFTLPLGDSHLKPDEILKHPLPQTEQVKTFDNKRNSLDLPINNHIKVNNLNQKPGIESETNEFPAEPIREIILVVEDSSDVRDFIRGSLEYLYTIIEAGDGEDGIKKAQEIIPDLIISDIMMPGIDGYELCQTLKKDIKTSHIPIILLTAKAAEENILHGLKTGADDYITKPFNTKMLMARIANLIDLRRQLQLNINREMTLQPAKINLPSIDKEFFHDLRKVISKNLSDPDFNVEQLAKKLYMDRSTVYRKILAITGETPTDFIRSCRLKKGAELLKKNFGTVLEVAFEVGFSSSNYFTKCFKKKFHQLPSIYQASEKDSTK